MSDATEPGKKKIGCTTWIILFAVAGAIAGCAGVVVLVVAGPAWILSQFLSDAPLDAPPPVVAAGPPQAIREAIAADAADGAFTLTPAQINALLPRDDEDVAVMQVGSDGGDQGSLTLSVRMPNQGDRWLNVHIAGSFDLQNGWFETLTVDELAVGRWDLGVFVAGQELATHANQNLAQQRAQDRAIDQLFDDLQRAVIRDGALELEVEEPTLTEILGAMGG